MKLRLKSGQRKRNYRSRFRVMLIISFLVHGLFLLGIIVSPSLSGKKPKRTDIHRVSIVSLPMSLQKKLPSASLPDYSPPPVQTAPATKKKKSVPQPKLESTPKPVAKKVDEVTTVSKKQDQKEPTAESFTMGVSREGMQRAGSLLLDTAYFPYMYYLKAVRDKIARNWFPPFGVVTVGQSRTLMVYFKIEKNGAILNSEVEESSENSLLDQSALRAVLVSNPFPPLPFGFSEDELGIHFRFECSR